LWPLFGNSQIAHAAATRGFSKWWKSERLMITLRTSSQSVCEGRSVFCCSPPVWWYGSCAVQRAVKWT
jgi:hypothetical protein